MAVRSVEKFFHFVKSNHGFYKVLNQVSTVINISYTICYAILAALYVGEPGHTERKYLKV